MLRVARLTDYGIVLMSTFAEEPAGAVRTSRDLAEASGLPAATVSKLLKRLQRAGLLVSQRGLHGGYVLARPASEITLAEVVDALEGPMALGDCQGDEPGQCLLQGTCPVRGTWRAINQTMRDALTGVTLAVVARPRPGARRAARARAAGREAKP
jgi:FeS assembly SUF system regulator